VRIIGLVPLPPYVEFAENGTVTFPPDTPLKLNDQRIGRLVRATPTADRESLELEAVLDDGVELPPLWIEVDH
jgi:hypothetical protein